MPEESQPTKKQRKSEDSHPPKKVSVILSQDYIRQIEDSGLTQTEALTKGLDILFSEDVKRIEEYKKKILEDEKKIIFLEGRLVEFDTLKKELDRVHEDHNKHIYQVQTLINQKEDLVRLLEDGKKKKKWWEIF